MVLLVVDDDATQLTLLELYSKGLEYPTVVYYSAKDVRSCLEVVLNVVVDLVITDIRLAEESGFDVLKAIKDLNPYITVIGMTAQGDPREAVCLLKSGADDYLVKPIRKDDFTRAVLRVHERIALVHEALLPPASGPAAMPAVRGIVYKSDVMAGILSVATRAAASSATVLISGESGTGKELVPASSMNEADARGHL
jgi:DNA-binding NtrC family response regulator